MIVALWFQDISGSQIDAETLAAHGVTHVIWLVGTWNGGTTLTFWQSEFAEGISRLHAVGIKVLVNICNIWNYQEPINVDDSSANAARVSAAVSLVNQYGFDGFADASEAWTGTEDNFIAYNNSLTNAMHGISKLYAFVNMCYPDLWWDITYVYGHIVADFVLPEFYNGGPNPPYFAPSFHECMAAAISPVVVGLHTYAPEYTYDLTAQFQMIIDELAAYPDEQSKYAGFDVYGASGFYDPPNPMFMSETDWAQLDAYLAEVSTFTLTINSVTGGTTDPSAGVTEHGAGEQITLTAYPDEENNYHFDAWIINGTAVSNNPYTFNVNSNTTVTPIFNLSSPPGNDVTPKLTIALGSVGIPQGDVITARVHLGGTKEVSSFELKLQNWNAKYSPSGTYPIGVGQDGSISIGRGTNIPLIITTRTEGVKFESNPIENYVSVSGRCWGEKLFRQVVSKNYISQKGEAIVKDLLDWYSGLSHSRNSVELVENTSTTFALLEYENTPVWDILRAIAESSDNSGVIGYDFRVAPDGKFEFFPRGSKTSPLSLSEKIEESVYTKNIFGVRNKIWIYGAADKSVPLDKDAWTESLTPSAGVWSVGIGTNIVLDTSNKMLGSASIKLEVSGSSYQGAARFVLNSGYEVDADLYPVFNVFLALDDDFNGNIGIVLLDTSSVEATYATSVSANNKWCQIQAKCGSANANNWSYFGGTFDWSHIKEVRIYCDFPGVGGGNFWVDSMYFGGRRYVDMQEDSTSQSAYGLRMLVDTDEELYSDNECMLRAKAVLSNRKDPAEYLTVKSTVIDYGNTPLLPGDKINVALPNENISADFCILSVEYEVDGKTQTLSISLELGREVPLFADYMYRLRSKVDHVSRHKIAR